MRDIQIMKTQFILYINSHKTYTIIRESWETQTIHKNPKTPNLKRVSYLNLEKEWNEKDEDNRTSYPTSTSHVEPSTNLFIHKVLTEATSFILYIVTCRSEISN